MFATLDPVPVNQSVRTAGIEGKGAFKEVLQALVDTTEGSGEYDPGKVSLSKEEIEALLKRMQLEMMARLWAAVVDEKDESLPVNVYSGLLGQPVSEQTVEDKEPKAKASNTRRPVQNIVGNYNKKELDPIIDDAARTYNVDARLIKGVIRTESNFNSNALSPKGAMGLMQLMPGTARDLGVKDAFNARENIMGGTRYLKSLLNRYQGDVSLALAAYNWGMGNVEKYPNKLPRETRDYISRVNQYYRS